MTRDPAGAATPHNLPRAATTFVGRDPELALIAQHLADVDCRLVTLLGPGGTGKTRLALEAAARQVAAAAFPDGVFMISLVALSDPAFLAPTVADAIGLPLQGQEDPATQLARYLEAKQMLLVLDNFEHMLDTASLLSEIVAAPGVKLLATSREALHLEEEWIVALGGLPVAGSANLAAVAASSAGQLFVQRARRMQAAFALTEENAPAVRQICRMVGGLPLGIELAAAWVKMLPCEEIAEEIGRSLDFLNTSLRNVPERHRSVRAVFEYSWQRLSPEEQRAFRQLSVFRGGFRREAAAEVVGARLPVLAALVDKSLLDSTPSRRYERHLLLYQYGQAKLAESPDEQAAVEETHAVYYAGFLQKRGEALRSGRASEALAEIDAEVENIRTMWRWLVTHGRVAELAAAAEALESFYDTRGWFREGEEMFGQAAAAVAALPADLGGAAATLLAGLTARQGGFRAREGRLAEAAELLRAGLTRLRGLDAPRELAYALQRLGTVLGQRGEYAEATRYHQESLTVARTAGDRWGVLLALIALALDTSKQGDYSGAAQRYQEGLALARELQDRRMIARTLNYLGYMLCLAGRAGEAHAFLRESLDLCAALGDAGLIPYVVGSLGQAAYAVGDYAQAQRYSRDSLDRARELGDRMLMTYAQLRLGDIAQVENDLERARQYFHEALHTAMEIAALPRALAAMVSLAQVAAQQGNPEGAAELLAYPLRHPAAEEADKQRADRLRRELLATLGAEGVRAAEGRGLGRALVAVVQDQLGVVLTQSLVDLLTPAELEVVVDAVRQADMVDEISTSDFFARLADQADALRQELAIGEDD